MSKKAERSREINKKGKAPRTAVRMKAKSGTGFVASSKKVRKVKAKARPRMSLTKSTAAVMNEVPSPAVPVEQVGIMFPLPMARSLQGNLRGMSKKFIESVKNTYDENWWEVVSRAKKFAEDKVARERRRPLEKPKAIKVVQPTV